MGRHNRSTKRERREARRRNPLAGRELGVGNAARLLRAGDLPTQAEGLDRMLGDLFPGTVHDRPPQDLTASTTRRIRFEGEANPHAFIDEAHISVGRPGPDLAAAAQLGLTVEGGRILGWSPPLKPGAEVVLEIDPAKHADVCRRLELQLGLPEGILHGGPSEIEIVREYVADRDQRLAAQLDGARMPLDAQARAILAEQGIDPDEYEYEYRITTDTERTSP